MTRNIGMYTSKNIFNYFCIYYLLNICAVNDQIVKKSLVGRKDKAGAEWPIARQYKQTI